MQPPKRLIVTTLLVLSAILGTLDSKAGADYRTLAQLIAETSKSKRLVNGVYGSRSAKVAVGRVLNDARYTTSEANIVKIAFEGDSRLTNPNGQGDSLNQTIYLGLAMEYGNLPGSGIVGVRNNTGYTAIFPWSNISATTGLPDDCQANVGTRKMPNHDSSGGDVMRTTGGVNTTIAGGNYRTFWNPYLIGQIHPALGRPTIEGASALIDQSDGAKAYFYIGDNTVTGDADLQVDWFHANAWNTAATNDGAAIYSQTFTNTGWNSGTWQVHTVSTPAGSLDWSDAPRSLKYLRMRSTGTGAERIELMYHRLHFADPVGVECDFFAKGGQTFNAAYASHVDSHIIRSALGPYRLIVAAFDVNDFFQTGGDNASEFHTHVTTWMNWVRSTWGAGVPIVLWLQHYPGNYLKGPNDTGANNEAEWIQAPGVLADIADQYSDTVFIETLTFCQGQGWRPEHCFPNNFTNAGVWSAGSTYTAGQYVSHNGDATGGWANLWLCKIDTTAGMEPGKHSHWVQLSFFRPSDDAHPLYRAGVELGRQFVAKLMSLEQFYLSHRPPGILPRRRREPGAPPRYLRRHVRNAVRVGAS